MRHSRQVYGIEHVATRSNLAAWWHHIVLGLVGRIRCLRSRVTVIVGCEHRAAGLEFHLQGFAKTQTCIREESSQALG